VHVIKHSGHEFMIGVLPCAKLQRKLFAAFTRAGKFAGKTLPATNARLSS